ncbi:MAG TPA: GreA/GreB family elongation factor [Solirubrobacteraceae bacterium]|nr:GreA/GreB family elongation factor [Solirubrobacteraceae bacterium]
MSSSHTPTPTPTVADHTGVAAADEILFGSTVSFTDRRSGRDQTFRLVSSERAEPQSGSLSVDSPVAVALLHHRVGDLVEVSTPSGTRPLLITAIQ